MKNLFQKRKDMICLSKAAEKIKTKQNLKITRKIEKNRE
jgi:hypothetical protein